MNCAEVFGDSVLIGLETGQLERKENGSIRVWAERTIRMTMRSGPVFLLARERGERYVLTNLEGDTALEGDERLWVLPPAGEDHHAAEVVAGGAIRVWCCAEGRDSNIQVEICGQECEILLHAARPRADVMGNRFSFRIPNGEALERTLAEFYWGTMLPSVIERTRAKSFPDGRGYVVSTLQAGQYAGTYPDVDHEFQCKGRLALADVFEVGVVRRMIELQLRMMREDPTGLWRNPCAVQPDGTREYHVRRNSMDGSTNAEMFLVTGNVEVLESAWLLCAQTKDFAWLCEHIGELEGAASLLEHLTDRHDRLWSDVYYEDQVMKDGAECMSQAMAANGLRLLAELEALLERTEQAAHYRALSQRLGEALVRPLPMGFWDAEQYRFADWLDRNGVVHDHIHLLANELPVLFGFASPEQTEAVGRLLEQNHAELQRFPTFLSPCIQDYTEGEIGDGGPYDLCAAGRYWCWDAAYWAKEGKKQILAEQLAKVAAQAHLDGYRMGERYDMNHVFYIDEKNWHGAAHYYEYPCVFAWVLMHDYLGISADLHADVVVCPRLDGYGSVRLEAQGIAYDAQADGFAVTNLFETARTIQLELGHLYPNQAAPITLLLAPGESRLVPAKQG